MGGSLKAEGFGDGKYTGRHPKAIKLNLTDSMPLRTKCFTWNIKKEKAKVKNIRLKIGKIAKV